MPRALWNGAISFGLVNIPIKLVTAVEDRSVSFRQIRRGDHSRIRHKKVAQTDGEEVEQSEILKGYEISPEKYVVIEPEELKSLDPKASRTIEIEDFVELSEIDPIYFDSSYYLVPQETAGKPYRLLHDAMVDTGKAAVARFVLRTKQYLAIMRPLDDAIAVSTMVFHDEVVPVSRLDGITADEDDEGPTDREKKMAHQLIDSMTVDWDPSRYEDTYRQKVLDLIEQKADGQEIVLAPDEEDVGEVVDLMAALEQSLQAAKDEDKAADEAQSA